MSVKSIPDGYHSITPYLIVRNADAALKFYQKAFDAREQFRLAMPNGSIAHAEFKIGDCILMIGEENPMWGTKGPRTLGGTPCGFAFYCEDCDQVFQQAVAAGCTVEKPLDDQFYGDRSGTVVDPDGHQWTICTHKKDLTPTEMQEAMNEWIKKFANSP